MKAEYIDHFGSDLMVVNVARESLAKWQDTLTPKDHSFIKWLAAQDPQHWSPFSHPKVQFRITIPFVIARQWEKHRIGAIRGYDLYDQNEVSRRYVDTQPQVYSPTEWRSRPETSIKQGSAGPIQEQLVADAFYADAMQQALSTYNQLLSLNVAPEQARFVLPVSTMTEWVETGSLMYWARLCKQRMDGHAQAEIRALSSQVSAVMANLFPISWPALLDQQES